jgi:hypothetical protein
MTRLSILFLTASAFVVACDSTEPEDNGAGEQEFITRLTVTLTAGAQSVVASASDPDGDGTDFTIEPLTVQAGTTYSGVISVFDDINAEDVGAEIAEEDDEHQFFITPGGAAAGRMAVAVTDQDENGLPVGLQFQLVVSDGDPASGTLNVVLSHYDEAPKDGVTRSDETDIDVTFPVTIE